MVVALPVAAVLVNLLALSALRMQSDRAALAVQRSERLQTLTHDLVELLLSAETGVRGYLASGNETFLDSYESALEGLPEAEADLLTFSGDVRIEEARIQELIDERLETLAQLRQLGSAPVNSERTALMISGKETMDALRAEISAVSAQADRGRAAAMTRERRLERVANLLSVAGGIAGLLGGLTGVVLFTRGVARRVGAVEENAVRLSTGAPLAPMPPGDDEVGRLGKALENAERLLQERARSVNEAMERAEAANDAKSDFLSRMSHELRTPLNAILGYAQVLELSDPSGDDAEPIDQILKAGRHLLELINEILDLAQIESGQLKVSLEPVEVADVVDAVLGLARPLAATRHIRLPEDTAGCRGVFVRADGQRLKQVLLNLVINAIKYNRDQGTVTVRCDRGDDVTAISVTDTGHGLSPDQIEVLFNPFERLGAEATSVEGTGLGLPLSRGLMEAMHGTLEVASARGHGSTFTIALPSSDPPSLPPLPVQAPTPASPRRGDVTRQVLYVEDNLSNISLVQRVLQARPEVELLVATDGASGAAMAKRYLPALVLLDLNLPDMSGEKVLRMLRAEPATADTPIVVLSADANPRQAQRLVALGATAYLTKPFEIRALLETIDMFGTTPDDQAAEGGVAIGALASLRELEEDLPGSLQPLIETFYREASRRVTQLEQAVLEDDAEAVRTAAHSLRGSSSSFAAVELARVCHTIETGAAAGDLSAARENAPRLRDLLETAHRMLVEQFPKGGPA